MNGEISTNRDDAPENSTFARSNSRDPLVDTTLDGRFYIEEVLGTGGMSVVYKARQLRVNRHVAIKTIRMQLDSKPVYKERFEREINSLCALNHPNIVTVYDCIIGPDGSPYVVMDYLRGRSLEALIKTEGTIAVERFASIAMQVCSALDHAHKKGIIHRDLKPGNVVLLDDENDFVKVVDFGLAKIREDNRQLTQSGELWGSPPYMSPEQCMGESGDERSDIYSLGAVMYEMIVGDDPFSDATSVFELIQRHVHASPPPFFQKNPKVAVPLKLESVIFKALEKSPLDRYQSAHELQDAIVEACSSDSGNLIYHPSRAGRSVSGSGIESSGAQQNVSNQNIVKADSARSAQSQQNAWFAGMLGAGSGGDSSKYAAQPPEQQNGDLFGKTTEVNSNGTNGHHSERSSSVTPDLSELRNEVMQRQQSAKLNDQPINQAETFSRKAPVVPLDSGITSSPLFKVWLPIVIIIVLIAGIGCTIVCMQHLFNDEQKATVSAPAQPSTEPASDAPSMESDLSSIQPAANADDSAQPAQRYVHPARNQTDRPKVQHAKTIKVSKPPKAKLTGKPAAKPSSGKPKNADPWGGLDKLRSAPK